MSEAAKNTTHINGWNSEPAKRGVQFANAVRVRTFEPITMNYGMNTGETEIVSNQNMTYGNLEEAFKLSRNKMQNDQQKSRQKRIQSRNAKREDYKKQIATNIRIVRRKLEEFRESPPNADILLQFQREMEKDLTNMVNILQQEDKLRRGIFKEEIQALDQLFSEIQQLQPATVPATTNIAAVLAAETETARKIQQGIHEVEQLLQDMENVMIQNPTGQLLSELDTMITQADQTIRYLLSIPKTPEERATIASLIGKLREMKGRHNQYILSGVGKKGGVRRKTRKQQRSNRRTKRSIRV